MQQTLGQCLPNRGMPSAHRRTPSPRSLALRVLRDALLDDFPGRIAVVSSFGAESAVLLSMVAEVDPAVPVLFIETGQHFRETLDHRLELAAELGLVNVRDVAPSPEALAGHDPQGQLWRYDPDACCTLRKVTPLDRALEGFDAWVTGRKRHQASTRSALPLVERTAGRTKINPLAGWTREMIEDEIEIRGLPRHPLVELGYPSIGCGPCTRKVAPGTDPRDGRWAGTAKTECGIHVRTG